MSAIGLESSKKLLFNFTGRQPRAIGIKANGLSFIVVIYAETFLISQIKVELFQIGIAIPPNFFLHCDTVFC